MALTDSYVQTLGVLPEFFKQIRAGQAPTQFTIQHLKDLGYTSTNHRLFLPLMKSLGFLTEDGKPTQRYQDYRADEKTAKRAMAEGLKQAYGDLFVLRAKPSESDRALFEGKFKSAHNTTDRMAKLMASTFMALLPLADFDAVAAQSKPPEILKNKDLDKKENEEGDSKRQEGEKIGRRGGIPTSLQYNIQIHLPATKDLEVYNAIFKSLREHLLD